MDRMTVTRHKIRTSIKTSILFAVVTTISLLSACSNPVDLRQEIETIVKEDNGRYLLVKDFTYALSEGYLNPTNTVEIAFDRPVDLSTLSNSTLQVRVNGGAPIAYDDSGITYNEAGNTVRFRCLPFFPVNSDISLTVSGVKGRDGSVLSGAKSTGFTTADVYACSVTSLTSNDATSSPGYTKTTEIDFTVEPSEAFQYYKFKISRDGGATWSGFITTYLDRLEAGNINDPYIQTAFDLASLFSPGPVPEGPITLRFRFFGDSNGSGDPEVTGLAQDIAITYDATVPEAPSVPDLAAADDSGSSNADNLTNAASSLTFTGSGETGATILLFDGATQIGSATANSSGTWAIDANLASGAHSLTAKARDPAGNTGMAGAALAVTVDVTAPGSPSAPDLSSADDTGASNTDNITKNISGLTLTGTAEANSTVLLFDGTTQIGTSTANGSGAWSFEATLAAGTHSLTAKARDSAGNTGTAGTALVVVVDTSVTAPGQPDLASADDTGKSNADNVTKTTIGLTFSGTAEANATVKLYNGTTLLTPSAVASAAGAWTVDFNLTAAAYNLTAKATDLAGNQSVASSALAVTVDTTAPASPTFTSGTTTPNRKPTWVWTSGGGGGGYKYRFESGSWTASSTASYTVATPLADAGYSLSVTELDTAGNESAVASRTITVNGVPNAPDITAPLTSLNATPTWSWTSGGFGKGRYRYQLDSTSATGWTATTSTAFTPGTALADGTHTLYVAEEDGPYEWSVTASKAIVVSGHFPVTGTTGTNKGPSLQVRPVAGATRYDFYLGLGTATPALKHTGSTYYYAVTPALAANTTYKWYVNAYNSSNVLITRIPASSAYYFKTGN